MASDASADRSAPPEPALRVRRTGLAARAVQVVLAIVVAAGIVLRCWPRSALWLDEAQTVAFARLPLRQIPSALRHDGAPPLYYAVLHVWMELVGRSDDAVRALSIVISLATLALLVPAARRHGGRAAVVPAVALMATNPFAIRYATETRMYALVMAEVVTGLILLPAALERPTGWRLAGVAALTAALIYTHYWGLYLIAALAAVLVVLGLRGRPVARVLGALGVGLVPWLAWLDTFRFQAAHTSTPWTSPPSPWQVVDVLPALAGGYRPEALVLAFLLALLIVLALFGRVVDGGRTELDWRSRPAVWPLAGCCGLTLLFALGGSIASGSAFVNRYTAVLFPLALVLAARGVAQIGARRARAAVLALACLAGLQASVREAATARTPATTLARRLEAEAGPRDVIVYCPDQLGPALHRRLETSPVGALWQGSYPDWASPERVDWIDYRDKYRRGSAAAFAAEAVRLAGDGAVWLVWSPFYPPTEPACIALREALSSLRPDEQLRVPDQPGRYLDHGGLLRYPAG